MNSRDAMALASNSAISEFSWKDNMVQATRGDGVPLCGNPRHPNGPWHPKTPVPDQQPIWALLTRNGRALRSEWKMYADRKVLWGCGCRAVIP